MLTAPAARAASTSAAQSPITTQRAGWVPAIDAARILLLAGRVLAVKGIGGFHLACDAGNAEAVARLPGLELRGLMCIPPADEEPRAHFAALRRLRDSLPNALPDLSMGMSGDFATAIEEGATLVRIGTAIFGPRPPG